MLFPVTFLRCFPKRSSAVWMVSKTFSWVAFQSGRSTLIGSSITLIMVAWPSIANVQVPSTQLLAFQLAVVLSSKVLLPEDSIVNPVGAFEPCLATFRCHETKSPLSIFMVTWVDQSRIPIAFAQVAESSILGGSFCSIENSSVQSKTQVGWALGMATKSHFKSLATPNCQSESMATSSMSAFSRIVVKLVMQSIQSKCFFAFSLDC